MKTYQFAAVAAGTQIFLLPPSMIAFITLSISGVANAVTPTNLNAAVRWDGRGSTMNAGQDNALIQGSISLAPATSGASVTHLAVSERIYPPQGLVLVVSQDVVPQAIRVLVNVTLV